MGPWGGGGGETELMTPGVLMNNNFHSLFFDQLFVHTALAMLTFPTISTLGGSPIAVAVPPMLENRTSAMRICIGSNPKASLNL